MRYTRRKLCYDDDDDDDDVDGDDASTVLRSSYKVDAKYDPICRCLFSSIGIHTWGEPV